MQANGNINRIKIVQQNVLKWTFHRRNELSNLYMKMDPDVILLNETGITDRERIKIFNYNIHQKNKESEDHAGVAIGIKKGISYQLLDDFQEDILAIKLETRKGPVIVATCYSPPRRAQFPTEDISRLMRKTMPVYLVGDLNARHQFIGHSRRNHAGEIINDLIERNITVYLGPDFNTRIGANGISRPDIILRNRHGFFNYAIEEGDLTTSDHLPVVFTLATTPIVQTCSPRKLYKRTNWDNVKEKLVEDMEIKNNVRNLKIQHRDVTKDIIDDEVESWMTTIMNRIDEETPTATLKYLPHPRESDLLKTLLMAYNILKHNAVTREQHEQVRILQEGIKVENIRLYDECWERLIKKLEIDSKDPKKFWDQVKRLMGGKGNGPASYVWDENRGKLFDDESKLNRFRVVWKDIFKITEEENANYDIVHEERIMNHLAENHYRTQPYRLANLNRLNDEDPLTRPLHYFDMLRIINNFKNKAPGNSGISKGILTKLPRLALERLNDIINILLSMGYFSVGFKNGLMVFAPKGDKDSRDVLNYRPITLLEVPGKVLEKTINERFAKHLENNHLFNVNQYGFRKGLGTELALAKTYELIALNQRERSQCTLVCRDVSKAFDKVWHAGLKFKILDLQLPDITEKILCSFLDDRKAQIKMNDKLSEEFTLSSGVPQGSILSPTMYIFYTSDMPAPRGGVTNVLFADDVTQVIEYHHRSKQMAARRTERAILDVNNYERMWKIKTNQNKFKVLPISVKKPAPLTIEGTNVNFSNNAQILGLTLGRSGLKTHISAKIAIAKGRINRLKRFRHLKPKTKSYLYKTLVRSAMEYPNIPLCIMSKDNKNKMQKFQNNVLRRYIDHDSTDSIEVLHNKYKVETINVRMHRRAVKTWDSLKEVDAETCARSIEASEDHLIKDHYWWRRIAPYAEGEAPPPEY